MPTRSLKLLLLLVFAPLWLATEARAECPRTCVPGQKRNPVTGCCEGAATPPTQPKPTRPARPAQPTQPVGPRPCAGGMERGPDTAGQCCWPGQAWLSSQGKCIGAPTSCPEQHQARGEACELISCDAGKARSRDTAGRCCWPGQAWSTSQSRCIGTPASCPSGFTATGDSCARPIDWVDIPGGTFTMGDTHGDGDSDEKPTRSVRLSSFAMARTETTVEQYQACVSAGACRAPQGSVGPGDHPVTYVDWDQASAFCRYAGGRLPTEAEWEYAARGTDGRKFPWGNSNPGPTLANCADSLCGDRFSGTSPVGSFPAGRSPFGLDDMTGNVWEWVADWFGSYDISSTTNPMGPSSGEKRVVRGGGFGSGGVRFLRAADRSMGAPSVADDVLGFRCARSP